MTIATASSWNRKGIWVESKSRCQLSTEVKWQESEKGPFSFTVPDFDFSLNDCFLNI